jgi:hypothetical protein
MQSASFKKPKIVQNYKKTDVTAEMPSNKMTDGYNSVKPNNGGKSMGKLAKKAKKAPY